MAMLARSFYRRSALVVARELLGAVLVHRIRGRLRAGVVIETEAYLGEADLASHASHGRTARTEVMFGPPGHAYVYLIYGMHHCVNVVTGDDGQAQAVLLRALAPLDGLDGARTDGPGRLCRALGITRAHNRADLCGGGALFLRAGQAPPRRQVARGPRIGVDYAGVWAAKPYRFWIRGHPGVSDHRGRMRLRHTVALGYEYGAGEGGGRLLWVRRAGTLPDGRKVRPGEVVHLP